MEKRAACVVVACCLLIHVTVIGSDVILYHTAGKITTIIYLIVQGVVYLLYPFLGWLSDVYITRYRSVLFSFIIMIVASVPMMLAGSLYALTHHFLLFYVAEFSIIFGLFGLGLFESTAIQFGIARIRCCYCLQLASLETSQQACTWSTGTNVLLEKFTVGGSC